MIVDQFFDDQVDHFSMINFIVNSQSGSVFDDQMDQFSIDKNNYLARIKK